MSRSPSKMNDQFLLAQEGQLATERTPEKGHFTKRLGPHEVKSGQKWDKKEGQDGDQAKSVFSPNELRNAELDSQQSLPKLDLGNFDARDLGKSIINFETERLDLVNQSELERHDGDSSISQMSQLSLNLDKKRFSDEADNPVLDFGL